jgi:hypothetical protein
MRAMKSRIRAQLSYDPSAGLLSRMLPELSTTMMTSAL